MVGRIFRFGIRTEDHSEKWAHPLSLYFSPCCCYYFSLCFRRRRTSTAWSLRLSAFPGRSTRRRAASTQSAAVRWGPVCSRASIIPFSPTGTPVESRISRKAEVKTTKTSPGFIFTRFALKCGSGLFPIGSAA